MLGSWIEPGDTLVGKLTSPKSRGILEYPGAMLFHYAPLNENSMPTTEYECNIMLYFDNDISKN